jgi:hypothetical protein
MCVEWELPLALRLWERLGGILFAIVGVVLVWLAYGLITNYRGAQDWLVAADERRFQLYGKGMTVARRGRALPAPRLSNIGAQR